MIDTKEYWEKRVNEQGLGAASTIGDIKARTVDEIGSLTKIIKNIYPEKVKTAIDFGSGWGRLLPVMFQTCKEPILVDFVDENEWLCKQFYFPNQNYKFMVCSIKNFHGDEICDYAITSFSLVHIIDDQEYKDSVRRIIESVIHGGHLFIYESYHVDGETAPHCSSRNREQFLEPFKDCELVEEIDWHSEYQPYEIDCKQPIRIFVFRRTT